MTNPEHEEEGFFRDLKNLCKKRLLPQAKRAWGELKKGGSDLKNTIATSKSQVQPRVREMKTKLTDKWERSESKKKAEEKISKAAETSEEWAKQSMEKIEETAKEWQPHVEKVKSKLKRKKKDKPEDTCGPCEPKDPSEDNK